MIGKLCGKVDSCAGNQMIIDVRGVGYLVHCSAKTMDALQGQNGDVSVLIETVVREDMINLYGFATASERDWFRLLQSVQGVGMKAALAILSKLDGDQLTSAILLQDQKTLSQADGVGPKLAARLANELKDKVLTLKNAPSAAGAVIHFPAEKVGGHHHFDDAVSALVNLGYKSAEAHQAVAFAKQQTPDGSLDDLIRLSLNRLSKQKA